MHIAHYTNTYYPVVSGVVRSVSAFRKALTEAGHNVFVFSQDSSGFVDKEPFIFRYPAIEMPFHNNFPLVIPVSAFIDRVLPILKLDVIHTHHPFLLGQTAAHKAQELDLPFVFTFHTRYRDYSHYISLNQSIVKEAIDRLLGTFMQQCHHIIVPSPSIKRMLADLYGVTEQVTVLPTGLDLHPYRSADGTAIRQKHGWGEETVLISAGRLAKEKNWNTLIKAAAEVIQEIPHVRLVILGEGDERRDLEKLAKELGVADKIELPGLVPFKDVPNYLAAADLFCFASVTETQGLVTMEAMAVGLPVVAVEAGGTADVIEDGKDGLLTADDPHALAQAIIHVLKDDQLRTSMQTAALDKSDTFDIKHQAEQLIDVYQQAIEAKKNGRVVQVDKQKPLLEGKWYELLGLEQNPFKINLQ
ncbi:MAG: glycosyltransferase [Candidatus Promineifilaceae bacterium]